MKKKIKSFFLCSETVRQLLSLSNLSQHTCLVYYFFFLFIDLYVCISSMVELEVYKYDIYYYSSVKEAYEGIVGKSFENDINALIMIPYSDSFDIASVHSLPST